MRFLVRANIKLFSKCSECLYFEPRNDPHILSKCRRFGEIEPDTKRVTYEYADLCRKNEHKCGPLGKYFEAK